MHKMEVKGEVRFLDFFPSEDDLVVTEEGIFRDMVSSHGDYTREALYDKD